MNTPNSNTISINKKNILTINEKNILTTNDVAAWMQYVIWQVSILNDSDEKAYWVIWKHIRHVVDHINAVINWYMETTYIGKPWIIDYPWTRTRGSKIENNFEEFKKQTLQIITKLTRNDIDLTKEATMIDFVIGWIEKHIPTTYDREMYYQFQHTTHHLAYIITLLKDEWIIVKNTDLGKSEATKAHEESITKIACSE